MNTTYNYPVPRLNEIRAQIDELRLSDSGIRTLSELINEANNIALANGLNAFQNQVRQTKEKQLYLLLECKNKPKKRINAWNETISNFKLDFGFILINVLKSF